MDESKEASHSSDLPSMDESKEASHSSDLPSIPSSPSFLEVTCKGSGTVRRFAPGTTADFAVSLINNKLDVGAPLASYIEAAKLGEEPISFGPTSVLLSFGNGWKLQTVLDSQQVVGVTRKSEATQVIAKNHTDGAQIMAKNHTKGAQALNLNTGAKRQVTEPALDFMYIGKIVVAFVFIFMLAGIFTLALENLPKLMLFINSSL